MINKRLEDLREVMRREHLAACIFPSTDPHQSEYISDHWKFRDWLSGFTGSNGTAVVTMDKAGLWTDSRYFLQAEQQLADSGFVLMRENGDTPDLTREDWLVQNLGDEAVIGIDGRLFSAVEASRLERFCGENGFMMASDFAPADRIWTDRPARPMGEAYVHDEALAGETVDHKLQRLIASLELNGADAMLISALDEIAWLFNMRGSDVDFTPVAIAHAYVSEKDTSLFIDEKKTTGGANGAVIGVSDIERSLPFYTKLLEYDKVVFDQTGVFEDLQAIEGGKGTLRRVILERSKPIEGPLSRIMGTSHLELIQSVDAPGKKLYEGRYWGDPGYIHLCFDVRHMDAVKEQTEAMGHPFVCDSGADFGMGDANGHFTYVEDPDGTLIEFVETFKIPIAKKFGLYLNLANKDDRKPLGILKLLRFAKVKRESIK